MAVMPPVALSAHVGGIVYVLEHLELAPGEWSAKIRWTEWDGKDWVTKTDTVPRDELTRIEGQNYLGVPEWPYSQVRRRNGI